jgi:hypothetical protein
MRHPPSVNSADYGDRYLHVAERVTAVLQALEVTNFDTVGWSSGGPYSSIRWLYRQTSNAPTSPSALIPPSQESVRILPFRARSSLEASLRINFTTPRTMFAINKQSTMNYPCNMKESVCSMRHIQHIRATISLLIPDVELIVPTSFLTCYHTGGTLTDDNGISRSDRNET